MPRSRLVARAAALAAACATGAPVAIVITSIAGCSSGGVAAATAAVPATGYSPQTVRQAYGVAPLLRRGVDGRGETIVLPETVPPAGNTDIRQDLSAFDKRNHLGEVDLKLVGALGFTGNVLLADSEEVQDVEMVQTIAPGAQITVMLVPMRANDFPAGLGPVLRAAAERGTIVSWSQSECETEPCLSAPQLRSLDSALRYALDHRVSVFTSSGDTGVDIGSATRGGTRGVRVPASSPLATGVGGTRLTVAADGGYGSETVWNDDVGHASSTGVRLSAGGGGVSARFARPDYQNGLPEIGNHRGVPDVAAMAAPGMATTLVRDGHVGTYAAGGTSESAPLWAGIAALADQDAHRQLGFLNPALYRIGRSKRYHAAFHDVTKGNNTVTLVSGQNLEGYSAHPGWDPVTGWGSPNAQVLIPLLGKEVRRGDSRGP